ncbi:MAG: (deoxy)nucleoside triphosphate pyrophosphohydrolase [Alphaproteobacteria bacterium]|nr:(deoxy)nucleoside triphosphate pyrophosphohydrolase [Alphaproteobacteria bacterium]
MKEVGTGIIVRDGKVLIAQRPQGKPLAGLWEFPGGKQEAGETIEQCLKRELKEELDIESEVGQFIMETVYNSPNCDFRLKVFFVHISENAELTLNVHDDAKWVTPSEMSNFEFPPADIAIVKKLQTMNI